MAANVDYETDTLIQTTLRDAPAFKGKSIIVIAHRINTVIDSDFIIVFSDGRVVEQGAPQVPTAGSDFHGNNQYGRTHSYDCGGACGGRTSSQTPSRTSQRWCRSLRGAAGSERIEKCPVLIM